MFGSSCKSVLVNGLAELIPANRINVPTPLAIAGAADHNTQARRK